MATRSKLSVDKVRKTTIIGMDIKRSHIEAGLVHPREHQKFSMPATGSNTARDIPVTECSDEDIKDILDFGQLSEQLIEDAGDDVSSDSDDEEPPPP